MSATFKLDRARSALFDAAGRRFDAATRSWSASGDTAASAALETVDAIAAITWLQRDSGHPLRMPVGVIGPRNATPAQTAAAFEVGAGLASAGFA
ncbi:MAG: hypothetical protein WA900_04785, partial [Casimicrobiaceae bacterium]